MSLAAQQACCPTDSYSFHIVVIEQFKARYRFFVVALSKACGAQDQSRDLRVSAALKGKEVNRQFFSLIPAAKATIEQHFRLRMTNHVQPHQGRFSIHRGVIKAFNGGVPIVLAQQFVGRALGLWLWKGEALP